MAARTVLPLPGQRAVIDDDVRQLLDGAAVECVQRLIAWAHEHAAGFGVRVEEAHVRRWRSIEDPNWVEAVIDLSIKGDETAAQRFWEAASEALGDLAGWESRIPVDLLWVRVHRG